MQHGEGKATGSYRAAGESSLPSCSHAMAADVVQGWCLCICAARTWGRGGEDGVEGVEGAERVERVEVVEVYAAG